MSEVEGETRADRRVHPATIPLRFLKDAPSALLGLPAALAFISDVGWSTIFGMAAVAGLITLAVVYIGWRTFKYGVGHNEIVLERGLFSRTRRSIPFDRIRDVDSERGPLHRLFGLAKVRIETGAGGKDEGVLDSLTLQEADRIRAAVRNRRAAAPVPAGPWGAPEPEAPAERTLFAMSLPRVLLSGLYNFSMLWIAGLFAVLQTFGDFLPFDVYDPGRWMGLVEERFAERLTLGAGLAVLLVALIIGVLFGIARTLARDYGFRLIVEGERYRRERGLFTRTEIVMPKCRVQLARVQTGPLRRHFGWFELHFQTLSQSEEAGGHQSVAPLARRAELVPVLAEQHDLYLPDMAALEQVSHRHIFRLLLRTIFVPAVIILALTIALPIAAILFVFLAPLVAAALIERRFHRYAIEGGTLFIHRGVWRQQLWIVPIAKAQTIRFSRNFLQRRLGLATLSIDTAGGPLLGGPRIVDLREEKARALAASLLDRLRQSQASAGRNSGTER